MSDTDSPSQPPSSASSSASGSRSALDSSSAAALTRALEGVRHDLGDLKQLMTTALKQYEFALRSSTNATDKSTMEVAALRGSIDRALKLMREVVRSQGQIVEGATKKLEDVTGKFQTMNPDTDEISAQHIKLRWSTLAKWAPVVAKVAGLIVAGAAAAYGFFEALVHRFRH